MNYEHDTWESKEGAEIHDDDCRVCELARLRALLNAPPAQMSDGQGNLIPIDSVGMRQIIDENARLRAERDTLQQRVEALEVTRKRLRWWRVEQRERRLAPTPATIKNILADFEDALRGEEAG